MQNTIVDDDETNETILKAKTYASISHAKANHKYDGKPYSIHLTATYQFAKQFINLIPERDRANVLAACWTHDLIEDARQTYNDVKRGTNTVIAEITYALTNPKGKTRDERQSILYYAGIRQTKYATFVKLCDRMANIKYSNMMKSPMLGTYRIENRKFHDELYELEYEQMFAHMNYLLKTNLNNKK